MFKKIVLLITLGVLLSGSCFATPKAAKLPAFVGQSNAALSGQMDVNAMQACIGRLNTQCDQRQAMDKWQACVTKLIQANQTQCQQTQAIFAAQNAVPTTVLIAGPVMVFTIRSLGDGINNYYMIDHDGHIIKLAGDTDDVIAKNKNYLAIKKQHPNAGLIGGIDETQKQIPVVKNKHGLVQLVFPQIIKDCVACPTLAVANISYRFTPAGKFVNAVWEDKKTSA